MVTLTTHKDVRSYPFRTNESAYVETKRKLLEECDLYCIVSLPGGVFSSAGAGVKMNLVFFTKGKPTEKLYYYDLSDVKVGKKTPLTLAHFDDFSKGLPKRADSPASWTVDHAARVEKAREDARPTATKPPSWAPRPRTSSTRPSPGSAH